MATKTEPARTRRESYSTPVTGASELPPAPMAVISSASSFQFISKSIVVCWGRRAELGEREQGIEKPLGGDSAFSTHRDETAINRAWALCHFCMLLSQFWHIRGKLSGMAETNLRHRGNRSRESRISVIATETVRVALPTKIPRFDDLRAELSELKESMWTRRELARAIRLSSGKKAELNFEDMTGLIRTIEIGLRWPVIDGFLKRSGLNQAELAEFLGVPDRTLARRREKGALTKVESERFARLVEIFNACMELFDGNSEAAREWLTTPAYGLNNVRPFDFAKNEFGAREVRNLIGRLQDGVFS